MNGSSEPIGAILQIIVFALVPFLVYLFQRKGVKGFLNYIGLKRSTKKANIFAVLSSLLFTAPLLTLPLPSDDFKEIMLDPDGVAGKFKQMEFGVNSIFILLLMTVFKTAFAEEILFRGVIAKQLINGMGFRNGSILQAVLFGILHAALFATATKNALLLFVLFIIPAILAYVFVYLNEKLADGSIIPGWISHGLANILSYGVVGFLI